eukprot:scpid40246/ scgid30906/ 
MKPARKHTCACTQSSDARTKCPSQSTVLYSCARSGHHIPIMITIKQRLAYQLQHCIFVGTDSTEQQEEMECKCSYRYSAVQYPVLLFGEQSYSCDLWLTEYCLAIMISCMQPGPSISACTMYYGVHKRQQEYYWVDSQSIVHSESGNRIIKIKI